MNPCCTNTDFFKKTIISITLCNCTILIGRRIIIQDWDLKSAGQVFIRSTKTVPGTIIGVLFHNVQFACALFLLLLTTGVLLVVSAALMVSIMPGSPLPL